MQLFEPQPFCGEVLQLGHVEVWLFQKYSGRQVQYLRYGNYCTELSALAISLQVTHALFDHIVKP